MADNPANVDFSEAEVRVTASLLPLFDRCVTVSQRGEHVTITCVRGLWSVGCAGLERARQEALRYWFQYYEDGEYDELLREAGLGEPCGGCGARGFAPSVKYPGRCEFCDGTVGGCADD